MKITPGKFIVVGLTPEGVGDILEYHFDINVANITNWGLFLVVDEDDGGEKYGRKAWAVSFISGNDYATGGPLDEHGESLVFKERDPDCEVKLVIDSDDEDGLARAFALVNGVRPTT